MKLNVIAYLALSTLSSCAALQAEHEHTFCNYDGAFKRGVNDAREGGEMDSTAARSCSADSRALAEKGYREGYTSIATKPTLTINLAKNRQPQECLEKYGRKVCGYNCIESYGKVYCANEPEHQCLEAYGTVKCGLNCKENLGKISCDVSSENHS